MATADSLNGGPVVVGMQVAGIEDYGTDYIYERDDVDDRKNQLRMLSRSSNNEMLRSSFQKTSLVPNMGMPLSMSTPQSSRLTLPQSSKSSPALHPHGFHAKTTAEEAIEEQDELVDLGYDESNQTVPRSPTVESMSPKSRVVSSSEEPQSEMDLRSGTSSDSEEESDGSESEEDSDDESEDSSSPWESSADGYSYDEVQPVNQPNAPQRDEATRFAMKPTFDAVVKTAGKEKDTKRKNVIMYSTALLFKSEDLQETEKSQVNKLQNIELVKWIKSDKDNDEADDEKEEDANAPSELLPIQKFESVSGWLEHYINQVYKYYRGNDSNSLQNCFDLILDIFDHFIPEGYKLMFTPGARMEEDYRIFKLFEIVLHTLARVTVKLQRGSGKFFYYLDYTRKNIFPLFKTHLRLLEKMYLAHCHKKEANRCIYEFVKIYYDHRDCELASDRPGFELCVNALVALDLYMEAYSPLNRSILSDEAAYDIESEAFRWLDGYNDKSEFEERRSDDRKKEEIRKLRKELCSDPQSRIKGLEKKYRQFEGFSFLRALTSWVIGHSKLYHQCSFEQSERYFFEALYCLKKAPKSEFFPSDGTAGTMRTELASLVLIDYADVLLENDKYEYAIVALEKTIDCLEKRQKLDRRFAIIRKLCITCTNQSDWSRAIKYHNFTLKKLREDKEHYNLNEFVYLSQQISKIHLKLNNFSQSEKELQSAIWNIYNNIPKMRNDHEFLTSMDKEKLTIEQLFKPCEGEDRIAIGTLILELATLYISGGNFVDQAIRLLLYLRDNVFTPSLLTRRIMILFQLSRGYFKNGRYEMAYKVMENILEISSRINNKLVSSFEFIQLRALIYLHCAKFEDAHKVLDETLKEGSYTENQSKKARINYLLGKVLQARCFEKMNENYKSEQTRVRMSPRTPTISENEEFDEEVPDASPKRRGHHRGRHDGLTTDFTSLSMMTSMKQHIHPEFAFETLLLAMQGFNDVIMQSKCCLEMGKTFLEIMMEYRAVPQLLSRDEQECSHRILKWLGKLISADPDQYLADWLSEDKGIKLPLYRALEINREETKDIGMLMESYIALAEFEFLNHFILGHGRDTLEKSKKFWIQGKQTLFDTHHESDDWIFLRRIDRHSRLQLFQLLRRLIRLLICYYVYDKEFIAQNVDVFVSYIALETFMTAQKDLRKRQPKPKRDPSSNTMPSARTQLTGRFSKRTSKVKHAKASSSNFLIETHRAVDSGNAFKYMDGTHVGEDGEESVSQQQRGNNHSDPTVTFSLGQDQMKGLENMQFAATDKDVHPLHPRYPEYEGKASEPGGEKALDELFRMHWKMRTESSMFSGGRIQKIDNDASLVQITECIKGLKVKMGVNSTLSRKQNDAGKCWSQNETFVIALDSAVFMFHPHTMFLKAVCKKRDETPDNELFAPFCGILKGIAFRETDFIEISDNPWVSQQIKDGLGNDMDLQQESPDVGSHLLLPNHSRNKPVVKRKSKRQRGHTVSGQEEERALENELCLPFLKMESVKELLMCLDPQNILNVLGAILSESRIVIVSRERCRALAIIDALLVLMYPFSWQYPCIPWLSPQCFALLNLKSPYIFGVANIPEIKNYLSNDLLGRAVVIDADTNHLLKSSKYPAMTRARQAALPLKIKSKLTRAMFRLMSGLLTKALETNTQKHWVCPPRRRDNMNIKDGHSVNISHSAPKFNLLSSPRTSPISLCNERKTWYMEQGVDEMTDKMRQINEQMIIQFQKEFCTAWVEVIEQYRLFLEENPSAFKVEGVQQNTLKYAHPRYNKFLSDIQGTRMFSSFQCIRSLAPDKMLNSPLFDYLVLRSLMWRQNLYADIKEKSIHSEKMKVTIRTLNAVHGRHPNPFVDIACAVTFNVTERKLVISPLKKKWDAISIQMAVNYELLSSADRHKQHPYIAPQQVEEYGERYQLKIRHKEHDDITLRCKHYYDLTQWTHALRSHIMDEWTGWILLHTLGKDEISRLRSNYVAARAASQ